MPKGYLNDEQLKIWADYLSVKDDYNLTKPQYKMICEIHADVFAHPYHEPKCTKCNSQRIKNWRNQIHKVYENRNSN